MKMLTALVLLFLLVSPVMAQPECPPPEAVELVYFRADYVRYVGTGLSWETAMELDNVGFNVYRSATVDSPRFKVNQDLIPAANPGTVVGAEYTFVDPYARGFVYWLEDVDVYGVSTFHGPAQLVRRLIPVRPRLSPSFGRVLGD